MAKRMRSALLAAALTLVPLHAAFAQSHLAEQKSFALPNLLREVSGLARASDETVFAHDDEHAIIHEINVRNGKIVRAFALGKPTVAGDFEGVAVVDDRIYLVTSNGQIFEAMQTGHAERTPYNVYDTQIGSLCEVEGIAAEPGANAFLLACKQMAADVKRDRVMIYRWSIDDRFAPPRLAYEIDLKNPVPKKHRDSFSASDLYRADDGALYILNSSGPGVLVVSPAGMIVDYWKLDGEKHPQAEGFAILESGLIAIADENKRRKGLLTTYQRK